MLIILYFWDGPWSGIEFEIPAQIEKIIVVDNDNKQYKYENDIIETTSREVKLRMVLTRNEKAFDEELCL
jgi:hypothetical protein